MDTTPAHIRPVTAITLETDACYDLDTDKEAILLECELDICPQCGTPSRPGARRCDRCLMCLVCDL